MSLKGFPHSEIPGSKLVCSSPGLIAAYRVLHRLLAPRHSPYALSSLTTSVWTHADRLLACASRTTCMRPLFSHCVRLRSLTRATTEVCSKRTTVCRIFSCQRAAEGNRLLSAFKLIHGLPGALAWPVIRSSFATRCGPPSPRLRRASFACIRVRRMVENTGLEPVTSWLQTRRSPS
jgi:hypothetical protein